ncbi:MAG: hypothetical protein LBK56_09550 [Gracilibacteraceae bacterium]|nr:hypothetical protein [Gracilibacteraceae bacterium]
MIAYDMENPEWGITDKVAKTLEKKHGVANARKALNRFSGSNLRSPFCFCLEEYSDMMGLNPEQVLEEAAARAPMQKEGTAAMRAGHLQTSLRLIAGLALDGSADAELEEKLLTKLKMDRSENPGEILSAFSAILDLDRDMELWRGNFNLTFIKDSIGALMLESVYIASADTASHVARHKVCWVCRDNLPHVTGKNKELTVAMLASQRVGKTITIATVITHMRNSIAGYRVIEPDVNFDLVYADFHQDAMLLYEKGYAPTKTETTQSSAPNISVEMERSLNLDRNKQNRKLTLSFVDIPGEFMSVKKNPHGAWGADIKPELYDQYRRLYRKADCLWFCADRSQLTGIIEGDDGYGVREDLTSAEAEDARQQHIVRPNALSQILNTLRADCFGDEWPPVAIILTKSERFRKDGAEGRDMYPYDANNQYNGPLHNEEMIISDDGNWLKERAFWDWSRKVRNFVRSVAHPYLSVLEDSFQRRAYFATSAAGHAVYAPNIATPDGKPVRPDAPQPFSPVLHLLWTLAVLGYLQCEVVPHQIRQNRIVLRRLRYIAEPIQESVNAVYDAEQGILVRGPNERLLKNIAGIYDNFRNYYYDA